MPSSAQAASTAGCGQAAVARALGGDATAISLTPATWAGTTFITTDDGYATRPPGTYTPDPADRHAPLGDGRARGDLGDRRRRGSCASCTSRGPAGRLLQRGPHGRVQRPPGVRERGGRDPGGGQVDAVEPGGVLAYRGGAALPDVLAHRPDRFGGLFHVDRGPRQHAGQLPAGQAGRIRPAQVDDSQHRPSLTARRMGIPRPTSHSCLS